MSPATGSDPSSDGGKKKGKKAKPSDDGDISNDVARFAARLGFGVGGGGSLGDSAFDDFDPAKAGRKIGSDEGKKKKKRDDGGGGIGKRRRAADDGGDGDAAAPRTPARPKGKSARAAAAAAEAAARSRERGSALNAALEAASHRGDDGKGRKRGGAGAKATAAAGAPSSTAPAPAAPAPKSIVDPEAPALWFDALEAAEEAAGVDSKSRSDDVDGETADDDEDLFARARATASSLLEAEAESSRAALARSRDADARWLSRARSEGTAADKVSASALLAGDSPAGAGLSALDDLLKLASKKAGARAGAVAALDALSDLFCGPLLPPDRKLVALAARPASVVRKVLSGAGASGAPSSESAPNRSRRLACSRVLLYWGLEDALRRRAGEYLSLLESSSRDGLDVVKRASTRGAANLLKSRPEGEARALALLVNKLGDPDRRSASDASHALMRVLDSHPAMSPVVAADAERAAFRPGQSSRARYACVLFLSSLPFPRGGEAAGRMAERLVDAYFGLFRGVLDGRLSSNAADDDGDGKKGTGPSKDARRKQRRKEASKARKSKGRGRKGKKGKGDEKTNSADAALRGGRVDGIDARLLGALLTGVRRAVPFLPASPSGGSASEALAERHGPALYALASSAAPFAVGVQALALLFQLLEGGGGSGSGSGSGGSGGKGGKEDPPPTSSAVSDRFYRSLYARLSDPRAPKSARVGAFLSLVYRAARADPSPRRACAFVKKLLQGAVAAPGASYAAACLLLVSELARERRALWGMVSQPEEEEEGEGEERPKRATASDDGSDDDGGDGDAVAPKTPPPTPSCWPLRGCGYDPTKREPLFCGASRTGLWELCPLSSHPHPSVAAFARSLLAGEPIAYDGDPLRDFSSAAVVDKIVSKKPKKLSPRASAVGVGSGATAAWTATKAAAESSLGTTRPDELFLRALDDAKAEAADARKRSRKEEKDKRKKKKRGGEEGDSSEEEGQEDFEDDDDAIDAFLAGAEDAGIDDEDKGGSRGGASAFEAALAAALEEDAEVQEAAASGGAGGGGRKRPTSTASKGGSKSSRKRQDSGSESEEDEEEEEEEEEEGGGSSGDEDGDDDDSGREEEGGSDDDDDDDEEEDDDDDDEEEEGTPDLDLPSASGSEDLTTSASDSGSDDDVEGNPWVMASGADEALQGKKRARGGEDEEEEESDDDDEDDEDDDSDFGSDSASDSDSDGGDLPAFASAEDFEDLLSRDEAGEDVSADAAARVGRKATRGKRARRG